MFAPLKLGWWNWQTRTFEGRMAKAVRVQVPPRAFPFLCSLPLTDARSRAFLTSGWNGSAPVAWQMHSRPVFVF